MFAKDYSECDRTIYPFLEIETIHVWSIFKNVSLSKEPVGLGLRSTDI